MRKVLIISAVLIVIAALVMLLAPESSVAYLLFSIVNLIGAVLSLPIAIGRFILRMLGMPV